MKVTKGPLFKINQLILVLMAFLWSGLSFSQSSPKEKNSSLTEADVDRAIKESISNWNYYMRNDLDSLKLDAYHIMSIGFEFKNEEAIHVGKRSLGTYLSRTGHPGKGIKYLKSSLAHFQKTGNAVIETEVLNEIGNAYLNTGKPKEAELYYLKSLKAGKSSPDPTSAFLAESNLAQAYIGMGNLEKATGILHHYKNESLRLMKLESVSNAYALLGTIEQQKENFKLAREYFRKSAEFGFRSKAKAQIAHAYNNMAIVYFQENDPLASLEYFKKALEIRQQTGNSRAVSESYFNLGSYYLELQKYPEALNYFEISEKYSKKHSLLKEEMDAVRAIADIHKLNGDADKALATMEQFVKLQENYYSDVSSVKTEDMELLESIETLEKEYISENKEAKLMSIIDNQKYHRNVLYIVTAVAVIALILLAIYRKKYQLSFGG
jgi:tetratricopeptide (TPR) repeat protein